MLEIGFEALNFFSKLFFLHVPKLFDSIQHIYISSVEEKRAD